MSALRFSDRHCHRALLCRNVLGNSSRGTAVEAATTVYAAAMLFRASPNRQTVLTFTRVFNLSTVRTYLRTYGTYVHSFDCLAYFRLQREMLLFFFVVVIY